MTPCHAIGCPASVGHQHALCAEHWAKLDPEHRARLGAVLRGAWPGAAKYFTALFDAVVVLARLEGRDPTASPLHRLAAPHLREAA